jgi:hypothetical protein
MRHVTLILLLAALGLLVACAPTHRGGGGSDDDDGTPTDDDDQGDDDDAATTDVGLVVAETPYGAVELPAVVAVTRSIGLGANPALAAGDGVTCSGAVAFGNLVSEAYAAFTSGAITTDEYLEMVSNAMLDFFGEDTWIVSVSSAGFDADDPIEFEEGSWDIVNWALGVFDETIDPEDDDMLVEGMTASGSSGFEGEILSFAGGLLDADFVVEGQWDDGEMDGEEVQLHVTVEDAPVCE